MMKDKIDITNEITALFEEELFQKVCIRGELLEESDEQLVEDIFSMFKEHVAQHENQVNPVSFTTPAANDSFLEAFELKAAGSKDDETLWYNQCISVSETYNLILTPFEDCDDEVDIEIEPFEGKEAELQKLLKPFENQTIQVWLIWNEEAVLKAEIYVHPEGYRASGEGVVLRQERPGEGPLSFKIDKK
ncbi:hypothetical protein [Photobacterium kasasachensis]|uniref:hypothetical protein n=1 Tax=Photobacterium kasasachensis TaxID=2910240 RepID=UPI003D0EBA6D